VQVTAVMQTTHAALVSSLAFDVTAVLPVKNPEHNSEGGNL
jgi:hypothetical protein